MLCIRLFQPDHLHLPSGHSGVVQTVVHYIPEVRVRLGRNHSHLPTLRTIYKHELGIQAGITPCEMLKRLKLLGGIRHSN